MESKKNRKKKPQDKGNGVQAKPKSAGEPKRYSLTKEELAALEMVTLKRDLANEKLSNARQMQEAADRLRQEWVFGVFQKRAIPPSTRAHLDQEKGIVTVYPDGIVPAEMMPTPQPEAPRPQPEATG